MTIYLIYYVVPMMPTAIGETLDSSSLLPPNMFAALFTLLFHLNMTHNFLIYNFSLPDEFARVCFP